MVLSHRHVGAKVLLAAATVFAMLSYGGLLVFLFLPLAVGYWWAVRHAGAIERAAWIVLGSLAAAQWAWEITFPVTEGDTPSSWIIAAIAGVMMAGLLMLGVRYTIARKDGESVPRAA